MNYNRANSNFDKWKYLVGLSKDFPLLKDLSISDYEDNGKFLPTLRHIKNIDNLLLKLGLPRINVIINRGQGCSTFYTYILNKAKNDSLIRKIIPIEINLGKDFWASKNEIRIDIEYEIKVQSVLSLVSNEWYNVILEQDYLSILNAWDYEDNLAGFQAGIINKVNNTLSKNEKIDFQKLKEKGPDLTIEFKEYIKSLNQINIQPIIFIDTSWNKEKPEEKDRKRKARYIYTAIKNIEDLILGNGVGKVIFGDHEFFMDMTNEFGMDYSAEEIEFQPYAPNEIFAMLNKQYNRKTNFYTWPKLGKVKTETLPLSALLDEKFITDIASNDLSYNLGLNQIMEKARDQILISLDKPWEELGYRLQKD